MEIIHAKIIYADTLIAEQKQRQFLFNHMIECFNTKVRQAALDGRYACSILWREFDIDEHYATDYEGTSDLLNSILGAGYEAEFCYNGKTVCNPCGVVVAWGPHPEEYIKDFFDYSEDLYRGE